MHKTHRVLFLLINAFSWTVGCTQHRASMEADHAEAPFQDLSHVIQHAQNNSIVNQFFDAIRSGNLEEVKRLQADGANINSCDEQGNTPLHVAVEALHIDCLKFLIQVKAELNRRNNLGLTPLHMAIMQHGASIDYVAALVTAGADVDICDKQGNAPLHTAVCWNRIESGNALLEAGANPNIRNHKGDTPLHNAVHDPNMGVIHIDFVKALLQYGANPNICNNQGSVPLHKVGHSYDHNVSNSKDLVLTALCALFAFGAKVNIWNHVGKTPLHDALKSHSVGLVRFFMKHGGAEVINNTGVL